MKSAEQYFLDRYTGMLYNIIIKELYRYSEFDRRLSTAEERLPEDAKDMTSDNRKSQQAKVMVNDFFPDTGKKGERNESRIYRSWNYGQAHGEEPSQGRRGSCLRRS